MQNDDNMLHDDDDISDSLHSIGGKSNSDDELCKDRYQYFNAERDMKNLAFEVGMRFTNVKEFKEAVRRYAINEGRAIRFKPTEPKKVRAKCRNNNCGWFIFTSIEAATKSND